jgi:acetyl-CoA/propionyl-CoA carboxylase biotin carboxyl carrier protein
MIYRFQVGERVHTISLERQGADVRAVIDGVAYAAEVLDDQPGALTLRFAGRPVRLAWAHDPEGRGRTWVARHGCTFALDRPQPPGRGAPASAAGSLRAPMPGQVRQLEAEVGQLVSAGQTILILEAMKMEIRIQAPTAGRLTRLLAAVGASVERDQVLAEIAPAEEA